MPGPRLPMRKIRDVLRLSAAGMSKRKIAASFGVSATAAGECIRRARRAGLPILAAAGRADGRVAGGPALPAANRSCRSPRRHRMRSGRDLDEQVDGRSRARSSLPCTGCNQPANAQRSRPRNIMYVFVLTPVYRLIYSLHRLDRRSSACSFPC